jgi:hypothetical protein
MSSNRIKGLNDQYNEKIPNYGDVFTKKEFIRHCGGMFTDYDGHGHPAIIPKNTKSPFVKGRVNGRIVVKPSRVKEIPEEATHVVWFNK